MHPYQLETVAPDDPHPANPHADIVEVLRNRRSTRLFDPVHELLDEELARILEAARWSPSAGNSQRWAASTAQLWGCDA